MTGSASPVDRNHVTRPTRPRTHAIATNWVRCVHVRADPADAPTAAAAARNATSSQSRHGISVSSRRVPPGRVRTHVRPPGGQRDGSYRRDEPSTTYGGHVVSLASGKTPCHTAATPTTSTASPVIKEGRSSAPLPRFDALAPAAALRRAPRRGAERQSHAHRHRRLTARSLASRTRIPPKISASRAASPMEKRPGSSPPCSPRRRGARRRRSGPAPSVTAGARRAEPPSATTRVPSGSRISPMVDPPCEIAACTTPRRARCRRPSPQLRRPTPARLPRRPRIPVPAERVAAAQDVASSQLAVRTMS